MRQTLQFAQIFVTLAACGGSASLALAISYRITELSPQLLNPGYVYARGSGVAVNSLGEVAFNVSGSPKSGLPKAALYRGGFATDLGNLPDARYEEAHGLNDHGHIVGGSSDDCCSSFETSGNTRAFIYDGTTMRRLSGLEGFHSIAQAINNDGDVVGWYVTDISDLFHAEQAFRHDGTTLYHLGTLGGSGGRAYDINNAGQITGWSLTASGEQHAFLYDGTVMHDLGSFGNVPSAGRGISSRGHVAGHFGSIGSGGRHAFLHDGETMLDLGQLEGLNTWAYSVNSSDFVVGVAYGPSDLEGKGKAFLYTPATGIVALSSLVVLPPGSTALNSALDINDAGQITGYGSKDGLQRGFLLTPVPEPSTFVLAVVLAVGWITGRRRWGAENR